MFKRAAGVRLRPREEIEVDVLFIRQPAKYRALRGGYFAQHLAELRSLVAGQRGRWRSDHIMRLPSDLELRYVELTHFSRAVNKGVVVGCGEGQRIAGFFERRDNLPIFR